MPSDEQKCCPDCLEPLHPLARKCVKCGSFQDFRRFTGQTSLVLSLLIALITVSTFVYNAWRSQNPIAGIDISTRVEQTEEVLDVVNTGEMPLSLRSVKLAIKFEENADLTTTYRLITIQDMVTENQLQMMNRALSSIALRSAGVIRPQDSKALRLEYVTTESYTSTVYLVALEPRVFGQIVSELEAKAEHLSELPVSCEYLVEYAFISKLSSADILERRVPANCGSMARIGRAHLEHFCAQSQTRELCD
ncbi:hypothetical protein [Pelagibius sp. Alg239-R121]|uniref:hypothetical protein n=1 Tax=Pelagibius sp. Alg239-R121 TaxID=2993448 RepID=UPI0024A61C0C|nr:hypothetical protein [Pelagibius sp. Alg239-R121]